MDALQITEQKLVGYLAALREEARGYEQRGEEALKDVQAEIKRIEKILDVEPAPSGGARRRRAAADEPPPAE